jgi:transposase
MPRHAPKLECPDDDREELVAWSKSRTEETRFVERAKIILACLEGLQIKDVAQQRDVSIPTVSKWRSQFALFGLRGWFDRPRSGKPPKYGIEFRNSVLKLLEQTPPAGQARWDAPSVAKQLGASKYAVWRVLRAEGIYLHRLRTWCVSTDKEFAVKAADIVGLYLDPPVNALVLSVDEKPSIQANERATGYVETDSGSVVRALKSTYKRHGTLNLFAALDVGTGYVYGQTTEQKKRVDFQHFLDGVIAELPADKEIHVILDNYSTHKRNEEWLAKYAGRVMFHFTPTSASWLNQVEIWFSLLSRKALKGASFKGKTPLREAIEAFIGTTNRNPRPFRWRKRDVRGAQLRNTVINLCN